MGAAPPRRRPQGARALSGRPAARAASSCSFPAPARAGGARAALPAQREGLARRGGGETKGSGGRGARAAARAPPGPGRHEALRPRSRRGKGRARRGGSSREGRGSGGGSGLPAPSVPVCLERRKDGSGCTSSCTFTPGGRRRRGRYHPPYKNPAGAPRLLLPDQAPPPPAPVRAPPASTHPHHRRRKLSSLLWTRRPPPYSQRPPPPATRAPPLPPRFLPPSLPASANHRSSNAEPAARPPPSRLVGVVGLRSPPPPNIRAAARPRDPPPAGERRRGRRGGCRQPSPLPRRESSNANPPGAAEAQSGPHLLGSPEESRSQRGQGLQRRPASPPSFIAFLTPTPRTRSTLSLARRAKRRHCGGGKGYSGNSSSAKMPSPWEPLGGTVPAGRGLREARAPQSPECVHVGESAARGAPPAHPGFPRRPERPTPQRGEAPAPSS
ncbi:basic salivary proline-rich protein 2-like [Vidua chalybeata]|uniref:basic salivary proline-rich protein 2-like n=1 Tax=Vidua chalybeata TaxID=81927 RepID=UPI0023A7AF96|nr:basic salivary proline-rich protein 2-like [Vidua chalybeata]